MVPDDAVAYRGAPQTSRVAVAAASKHENAVHGTRHENAEIYEYEMVDIVRNSEKLFDRLSDTLALHGHFHFRL